jgi:hypothetical protein
VPNRVARGLAVAAAAAVAFFVAHVGGWGLLDRLTPGVALSGFAVGLPVALILCFLLAAPALRAMARRGCLRRARAVGLGALAYGGIVFLWMAALRPGPPEALERLLPGGEAGTAATVLYRHVLTPAAFALYGAAAAALGWRAAFGARAEIDPDAPGALEGEAPAR